MPEGGAGQLTAALRRRLEERGGQVVCNAPVSRIILRGGRAVGVECLDQTVRVRRAVLADVGAEQLYGGLVGTEELPARLVAKMTAFRRDPATFKVDYALSGPVPWASPPAYAPGTVHIADSYADMLRYGAQLAAGAIPDRPFLLMGQMTTTDPTRSPAGTESLWVYTHLPQQVRDDAGGELTGSWSASEAERFADRMQAMIESSCPGFRRPGAGPADPHPGRPGGAQRQPGRRLAERWHRRPGPAGHLPPGARSRPRRDPDPRALPRLRLRPSGRQRARRMWHECRPRSAVS